MYSDPEKQKEAARRHYERNREVYRERNDRKRARLRQMVVEAKSVPCTDCGETLPPYCMDFDHRDRGEKEALISHLVNQLSTRRLLAEIAKCDVVCANCHRIRTWQQVAKDVPRLTELATLPGLSRRQAGPSA